MPPASEVALELITPPVASTNHGADTRLAEVDLGEHSGIAARLSACHVSRAYVFRGLCHRCALVVASGPHRS